MFLGHHSAPHVPTDEPDFGPWHACQPLSQPTGHEPPGGPHVSHDADAGSE